MTDHDTLWKFNASPLKIGHPKRWVVFHPSGVTPSYDLNFGRHLPGRPNELKRSQSSLRLCATFWHLFFLLRGSLGEFFSRSDILGESLKTTTLQQIPFSCRTITVIQNVDKSRLKHSKRAQLASVDSLWGRLKIMAYPKSQVPKQLQ